MSATIYAEVSSSSVPLELTIEKEGTGGITGQAPTVALRDGATIDSYLDWSDETFKTAGWTLKFAGLTEVGRGHYQRIFNPASVTGLQAGATLVAEYHVDNGGDVRGDAHDIILMVRTSQDVTLLRKALTNRVEESPGTPGQLVLFDDDDATQLLNWKLRDANGNGIVSTVGAPSRRAKAT